MRVLTVTPLTLGHGGHSRHKEMICALLKDGHEVVVVAPPSSDASCIEGVEHWSTSPGGLKPSFVAFVVEGFATMLRRRRQLRGVDRVFVVYEHSLLAVLLVRACTGLRFPVIFLQRLDITTHMRFGLRWAKGPLERVALSLRIFVLELIQRLTLPRAALIIAQTDPLADRLAQRITRLPSIAILPNNCRPSWTHADALASEPAPNRLAPSPVIGFVGNCFYRSKGMDLLAEAFRIVLSRRPVRLVVLGDGPGLVQFRSQVSGAGIAEQVCLLGRVANAWRYMANLDVLVAPARLDNCPNVVLEALAANVPIVATHIDAHEYILGKGAPQLAPCEPSEIAARIERILFDPAFRDEVLAHQTVRCSKFDFDWQARVADLITTPLPYHRGAVTGRR